MSYTTLVDVETLRAHLDDPNWLVVDVRHQLSDTGYGERAYAAGHIPKAKHIPLGQLTDIAEQDLLRQGFKPGADGFELLRHLGDAGQPGSS